jgi:hypothetical protein
MQLPLVPSVGSPAELAQTAIPWNESFFATIIAPFKTGGIVNKLFFWWHLISWVLTLGVAGTANSGAMHWQKKTDGCASYDESCFKVPVETFTGIVGHVATASLLLSIIMILISAAVWTIDQARREVEYHMILWFLNSVSLFGSFWVYIQSGKALTSVAFYLSTATCILHVYSSVLLYSCMAAMKMVTVSRTTIPTFSTALSILVACAIQLNHISLGDAWDTGLPIAFSYGQKFVAFLVPSFQLAGLVAMVVLRRITANENSISEIEDSPFIRTTILFSFFFACCCNFYVWSYARNDTDFASGMLAQASVILSCFSVLVVFAPDAKGEFASSKYDWKGVAE